MPGDSVLTWALRRWDAYVTPRVRMRHLPPRLLKHLSPGERVLDVGSHDGALAHRLLVELPSLSIAAVDIAPARDPLIPVAAYDGVRLPFPDDSFDTVLLADVLHHDTAPGRVLAEAARVARRRVLVKDHHWSHRLDWLVLALSDYLGNRARGIRLPYHYLTLAEWERLFADTGLNEVTRERFRYGTWDRCPQVVFVLRVPDA